MRGSKFPNLLKDMARKQCWNIRGGGVGGFTSLKMYVPFCLPPSWCSIVVYLHLPPPLASHLGQALWRCWREQSACRGSTASRLALVHLDRAWLSCVSSW